MGIRLPQSYFREGALLSDHTNRKDTVYDVHYLAKCLRELGMEATLPIPLAKRTRFTHYISRIPCSIGVDDGLIFERDLLVSEYFKLDKRIKPLIVVILHFTKLQRINKACAMSTLSSYSYIIILLHFLMNIIENPIIPNLQGQLDNCNSPELNIRYHTCVRVINKQTNIYSNNDENYEACTIWYSENDDTMGALFIKFMDYCARRKNYKCISIVNGGSDYASFRERAVNKDDAWIQDPFLLEKNIARGCKFYTLKNIAKTFNSAAAKLKQGSSLQDICDMDTYFSNKN
ncbi:hypothetical protein BDF21DRAFT_168905 [Thamnidium elegans]|nr:hypothetical protein BDF21DRAFT_168905 [Thamnidium elegans]